MNTLSNETAAELLKALDAAIAETQANNRKGSTGSGMLLSFLMMTKNGLKPFGIGKTERVSPPQKTIAITAEPKKVEEKKEETPTDGVIHQELVVGNSEQRTRGRKKTPKMPE